MKEFYGSISLTARVSFILEAENIEEATNKVFEDMEGLEVKLKEGSTLEISEIQWDLLSETRTGNVQQPNISDFDIEEEK